jgi:hypothetical protein
MYVPIIRIIPRSSIVNIVESLYVFSGIEMNVSFYDVITLPYFIYKYEHDFDINGEM